MIKKTIKFDNLDGEEVTQDFYFHMSKLEAIELELEYGGLERTILMLTKTENAQRAYSIFKEVLLKSYGVRGDDGGFYKEAPDGTPYSRALAASPALDELVLELLENPEKGSEFFEGILPEKLVAQAKQELARRGEPTTQTTEATPPAAATDGTVDYEAMLKQANEQPSEPVKKTITQHEYDFMKGRLNESQFKHFMSTRVVKQD